MKYLIKFFNEGDRVIRIGVSMKLVCLFFLLPLQLFVDVIQKTIFYIYMYLTLIKQKLIKNVIYTIKMSICTLLRIGLYTC